MDENMISLTVFPENRKNIPKYINILIGVQKFQKQNSKTLVPKKVPNIKRSKYRKYRQ